MSIDYPRGKPSMPRPLEPPKGQGCLFEMARKGRKEKGFSFTFGPKVKCKRCEDIIQSKPRHDFVTCKCEAISIDGGSDYTKMSALSDDPYCHEFVKENE